MRRLWTSDIKRDLYLSGTLRIINIHGINWGFIHDISTKMFSIPLRIGQNEQVRKNKKQLLIPDKDKGLVFAR